ncbi:hypothetical protein O6H91_Y232100 [Diphasiastrum complanatum]|nr:hypothetical protein O6H91_Y232100 [Diphasiastrum complanatum]
MINCPFITYLALVFGSYNILSLGSLTDPPVTPYYKPIDYVQTLAEIHEDLEAAQESEKSDFYMEQYFVFKGMGEKTLLQRSLSLAQERATSTHKKIVYAAWIKYEGPAEDADCNFTHIFENYEPLQPVSFSTASPYEEVVFQIGCEKVYCNRQLIAALSRPFQAMLRGSFSESGSTLIEFSQNGISAEGMRVVDKFTKTGRLETQAPDVIKEVLSLANRFFCDELKAACDSSLAGMVHSLLDATRFIDCAVEESSQLLIAACLWVFLLELPNSLQNPKFVRLFSEVQGRMKLLAVGHCSYALYALLSQVAIEKDISSDLSYHLVKHLKECAVTSRQQLLALHQYGCVMLARKNYADAEDSFEASAKIGHAYSIAGVARAKCNCGKRLAAYTDMSAVISCFKPTGWMYEERSLYSMGKGKLADLDEATEHDPKLPYPYKYRAVQFLVEGKFHEAHSEINRILIFKISPDLLEIRVCICFALHNYAGAVRDLRVVLTLDPDYTLSFCGLSAAELLKLHIQYVQKWTKADCWMHFFDLWSSLDYVGSLAVIHQMLESDSRRSVLFFRQSILLSRLSCSKAAIHSLRLAQEHAIDSSERLVYDGWIYYDTGNRKKALQKANESIDIQPSFQAFFLKAYIMSDKNEDGECSTEVVRLLREALKYPSDCLQKGQIIALNNLASAYADCGNFELATNCYKDALRLKHTRALRGLARIHCLQGDLKSALDHMTKLIENTTNNVVGSEKRSDYGPQSTVMADLAMITLIDPLQMYPYRHKAAVFMDTHQDDRALEELSKAIAFKADPHLLQLRAAFYESIGDASSAFRDCRAALSMDPNHRHTLEIQSHSLTHR